MVISVDKDKCTGCGACATTCPEVFVMKNGKAKVKKANSNKPCVKEAEETCPVNAIIVK